MIADLKPYPAYKDSGVPWLGDVPAHWEAWRGKTLFQIVDVRSRTGDEELLTVSSERGVVPRASANVTMFKAESYVGYKLCWPGDLVINSLWAWARGLGVSRYHGIVSSAYGVYRLLPKFKTYSQFIHNLVRSAPFQWELQVRSKGIWVSRLQLTDEAFLGAPFPLPPLPEQAAIVRFLDHIDRRIQRYINAKQKLLTLLEEQKQAIIHRAVTRGLDANVRLKPSGVEWLGEVPEHWEIRRLKQVSWIQGGFAFPADSFGNEGVPVVQMNNLRRGALDLDNVVRIPEHQRKDAFALNEGDIIYGLSGSIGATGSLGNYAVVRNGDTPAQLNQRVARFRPAINRITGEFLVESLRTSVFYEQVLSHTTGTAQFNVSTNAIGNVALALPPVEEQRRIVCHLSTATAAIDTAIDHARRQIELLREYRTRLIADVVTGKLDVREDAARLPDGADEPKPFDESEEWSEPTNQDIERSDAEY